MSTTPFSELIEQAKEVAFKIIPAGKYPVICKDCSAVKSSTGKDMLKLSLRVVGGPYEKSSLLANQTLSPENPAAVAIFLKFLNSFGVTEEWLAELPPREDGGPNFGAVAAELKGKTAIAEVGIHEWNGEDRNGVDKFFPAKGDEATLLAEAASASAPADPFKDSATPANASEAPF